jgi:hypothetical protein
MVVMSMTEPETCAECGFDGTRLSTGDAITGLRSMGRRWREAFKDVPDDVLRRRPDEKVWSPLEYAAHTRDVLALNGWGMAQVLDGNAPSFPAVEAEPDAADHGYNKLDPSEVVGELGANADRIAARAERALPEHWSRTATLGGRPYDAAWILRHALHDASHHLRDVQRIIGSPGPDDEPA